MTYFLRLSRGGLLGVGLAALSAAACSSSLHTGGSGGSGGQAAGGSGGEDTDAGCRDLFYGGTPAACCPEPPPDCSDKPDGYPGYPCVSRQNQYCSCACQSGQWSCGC